MPTPATHSHCTLSPVAGWYGSRSYHHTGMVSMWYAMREALAIVSGEACVGGQAGGEVHCTKCAGLHAACLRRPAAARPRAQVAEEGMEAMWARHLEAHQQLWKGLTEMGLEPFVENPADRLVTVNTIKASVGVVWVLCVSVGG